MKTSKPAPEEAVTAALTTVPEGAKTTQKEKVSKSASKKKAAAALATVPEGAKTTVTEKVSLPCALKSFFQYSRLAWGNCLTHRVRMAVKAGRFTVEFIDAQLEKVDEVEELPTLKSRIEATSTAKVVLEGKNQALLDLGQYLKGFIEYAYKDKTIQAIQLRSAGFDDYGKAAGDSWATSASFLRDIKQYIAGHSAILLADGDMPVGFDLEVKTAGDQFQAAWDDFIAKKQLSETGTGTQEEGLEELKTQLNPMLAHGKRTFKYEPLLKKLFTTASLLDQVRGHHQSGVEGIVRLSTNEQPKPGVRVSVQDDTVNFVVTDEEGRYKLPIASGVYSLSFTSDTTEPYLVVGRKVKVGVMGRLSPNLQPVVVESIAPPSDDTPAEMDNGKELAAAVADLSKQNGVASH